MKKVLDFNAATYIVNLIKKFFVKKTDIPLNIETTDNKVNTLVDANTELYPSTKGVKNYVDTILNTINKTIEDNKKLIDTNTSDISTLRNTINNKISSSNYATTSTGGTVKIPGSTGGISITSSGVINVRAANESQIAAKSSSVLPLVPSKLDYAVKTSLATNTYTLTTEETKNILNWLGVKQYVDDNKGLSEEEIREFLFKEENLFDDTFDVYSHYFNAHCEGGYYFYNNSTINVLSITCNDDGSEIQLHPINEETVRITGVGTPINNTDAANKEYVDGHNSAVEVFTISDDDVDVEYDDTKGVAPYSTSYGYTNITVNKEGFKLVEGGLYFINGDTKLIATSNNRNVRIRVGETEDWMPVMGTTSILAGNSYFIKSLFRGYVYSTKYIKTGAFHLLTDSNTTYTYLVNTLVANTIKIDNNGYGAKYSLMFPTEKINVSGKLETYSSLVSTTSNGTTKSIVTPTSGKFYLDRTPLYVYTANETAGSLNVNALYQKYNLFDVRYTLNTSSTYMSTYSKAFLYLHNFNPEDYSFESDKTVGNVVTIDKLLTRFPSTTKGSVYLYFLGWTSGTWYLIQVNLSHPLNIFKYTPNTGELIEIQKEQLTEKANKSDVPNVVQVTGTSTSAVMSQDAITKALASAGGGGWKEITTLEITSPVNFFSQSLGKEYGEVMIVGTIKSLTYTSSANIDASVAEYGTDMRIGVAEAWDAGVFAHILKSQNRYVFYGNCAMWSVATRPMNVGYLNIPTWVTEEEAKLDKIRIKLEDADGTFTGTFTIYAR